jgi:hypothetical protein
LVVRSFATAAQLELSAAGIKAPAQSQSLLGGQLNSPIFQTIKQHEAQAAAPAPAGLSQMTDSASRDDLNSYFDSFKAPNSPKLAAVQQSAPPATVASGSTMPDSTTNQLLAAKLAEQDAVIKVRCMPSRKGDRTPSRQQAGGGCTADQVADMRAHARVHTHTRSSRER